MLRYANKTSIKSEQLSVASVICCNAKFRVKKKSWIPVYFVHETVFVVFAWVFLLGRGHRFKF